MLLAMQLAAQHGPVIDVSNSGLAVMASRMITLKRVVQTDAPVQGEGQQNVGSVRNEGNAHPAEQQQQPRPPFVGPKIVPGQLQPVNPRPPIFETVYIPPNAGLPGRVTSVSYGGTIQIQPADTIELRLRAPYPTELQILINRQPLSFLASGGTAPQPDTAGYFTTRAIRCLGIQTKSILHSQATTGFSG